LLGNGSQISVGMCMVRLDLIEAPKGTFPKFASENLTYPLLN